jgi:hypothetical protein
MVLATGVIGDGGDQFAFADDGGGIRIVGLGEGGFEEDVLAGFDGPGGGQLLLTA